MAKAKDPPTDEEIEAQAEAKAEAKADAQAKAEAAERKEFNASKEAHRKEVFAFALTKEATRQGVPEADLVKAVEALPEQDRTIERVSVLAERMGDKAKLTVAQARITELEKAAPKPEPIKRGYLPSPAGGNAATQSYKELLGSGKPMPSAQEIDRMVAASFER